MITISASKIFSLWVEFSHKIKDSIYFAGSISFTQVFSYGKVFPGHTGGKEREDWKHTIFML